MSRARSNAIVDRLDFRGPGVKPTSTQTPRGLLGRQRKEFNAQEWLDGSYPQLSTHYGKKVWLEELRRLMIAYQGSSLMLYNTLIRMEDQIAQWALEDINPSDVSIADMRADLKRQVGVEKAKVCPTTSPYTKVALIAFNIVVPGGYVGDKDDQSDINARMEVLKRAVEQAVTAYEAKVTDGTVPVDEDAKTLKLFMGPEFYFRGGRGAYDIIHLFDAIEKFREITAPHQHWLFVGGTFVCTAEIEEVMKKQGNTFVARTEGEKEKGYTLENYALVQMGGYTDADRIHDLQVAKVLPSNLDFNWVGGGQTDVNLEVSEYGPEVGPVREGDTGPRTVRTGETSKTVKRVDPPRVGAKFGEKEQSHFGSIFHMEGITFGLEVCLDHACKRLMLAPDKDGVQIHLIPSWGMTIYDGRCSGRKTGHTSGKALVFNVDGKRGWKAQADEIFIPGTVNPHVAQALSNADFDAKNGTLFPNNGKIKIYRPIAIPVV
jgi:hypothetical protein